jgi:DNA-directed RNA polymerase specialized sigma24 family protein
VAEETSIETHDTEIPALEECLEGLHENTTRLISGFYLGGRTAREISEGSGKKELSVWVTIIRIRRARSTPTTTWSRTA